MTDTFLTRNVDCSNKFWLDVINYIDLFLKPWK